MKPVTRIGRLEQQGRTLAQRILRVQQLYESDWLQQAWRHVQDAVGALHLAKISAEIRMPVREDGTR